VGGGRWSDFSPRPRSIAKCQPRRGTRRSALLFQYEESPGVKLFWLDKVTRAKVRARLAVVLILEEARALLARLRGMHRPLASSMFGAGLRLIVHIAREGVEGLDDRRREYALELLHKRSLLAAMVEAA
jgi:hypothetical protein